MKRGMREGAGAGKKDIARQMEALRSLTDATAMNRTESLRCFKDVVTSLGGDPVALLEGAGIEPSLLDRKGEVRQLSRSCLRWFCASPRQVHNGLSR